MFSHDPPHAHLQPLHNYAIFYNGVYEIVYLHCLDERILQNNMDHQLPNCDMLILQ